MGQLFLAVVTTIGIVLFAMANTHHVELSYVVGAPIQIRLIFLMAISLITGCTATLLAQMILRVVRKTRDQALERFVEARTDLEVEAP